MKQKKLCVVMVVLLALSLFVAGCQEQQRPKVWGQGELPTEWQGFFAGNNLSRLNFYQMNMLSRQQAIIFGISVKDPNGQPVRKRGLIERVTTLEALTERIEALEEAQVVIPVDSFAESLIRHSEGP